MSDDRLDGLSEEEIAAVERSIGRTMLNLPLLARQAGHKRPLNTMRDYVQADPSDKIDRIVTGFLHDLLEKPYGMKTEELLSKWYGIGPED